MDALIGKLDDPYTDYLSPAELKALRDRTDRAYYGVGLQVAQRGEGVVVVRVYDGSPAADAGREGRRPHRLGEREDRARGAPSTPSSARSAGRRARRSRVGFQTDDAAPRELTMTRARIRVPAVDSRIVTRDGREDRVHRARPVLPGRQRCAARHHHQPARAGRPGARARPARRPGRPGGRGRRHRRRVPAEGLDGRGDPGRALGPQGHPHRHRPGRRRPARWRCWSTATRASASEIVAGALRDSKRGTLVGERTFGKALVQSTVLLRNGGALKLTTAALPHAVGLRPGQARPAAGGEGGGRPGHVARRGAPEGPGPGGRGMSRGGPATALVAELVSSGRGAAAQPAFEPGPRDRRWRRARAAARASATWSRWACAGGPGRVVAVHGPASSPRAAMRALLASEDMGRPFPRAAIDEADALDEASVAGDRGPPRPARPARRHHRPARREGPRRRPRDRAGGGRRVAPVGPHRRRRALRGRGRRDRPRGGPAGHVRLRPRGGQPDAAGAPLVRPLQPAPRRRPGGGHGRDGGRRRRARSARRASRGR